VQILLEYLFVSINLCDEHFMSTSSVSGKDWVSEVRRVLECEGQALLACAKRLEQKGADEGIRKALELMQQALSRGNKIVIAGVGKSGKIGQKIAATFCSTGSLAVYLHPTEGLHGDLGLVQAGDAVLALSYTGNTEELVRLIPSFKSLKVPVIALCGNRQSKLAQQADVWIDGFVEQEACPHNLAPTSSTTLALALGDALALALMQWRGFDAQAFAQNHPGGSLGNRLNLRVSDVMHQGDAVACVSDQASMDEVVVASTQKRLGAVLVVQDEKLLGIITDGDIRRALQHREKFFMMKAGEVMTRSPVTASPEMMAKTALELMENRPRQISVIPVVDENGCWKGVVRVHDLVRTF
jgi:arabinose-5-phosphate isomerase